MKTLARFSAVLVCIFLTGCATTDSSTSTNNSAAMSQRPPSGDIMRTGDKITIQLSGVPEQQGYIKEVQIPATGEVTVDYLNGTFPAAGRTPSELATDISGAYRSQQIYTNPIVTVIPGDRYVNVGGDVRSPSRVVYSPDMTVMSAINSCGGFTEYARKSAVRILRGQQVIQVDCVKAALDPGADPPVYPGDQIYVPRTAF
jgi:protein involved in polysaccharide export with SLBB domain